MNNQPVWNYSRRKFLKFLAATILPFRILFNSTESRASEQKIARNIRLAPLNEIKQGPNYFPIERVVVFRKIDSLRAMSIICTHQPCALKAHASGFDCTCHGSRFSSDGKLLNGPAREDLPHYRLSLDTQGNLSVHFDEQVPGDWTLQVSSAGA